MQTLLLIRMEDSQCLWRAFWGCVQGSHTISAPGTVAHPVVDVKGSATFTDQTGSRVHRVELGVRLGRVGHPRCEPDCMEKRAGRIWTHHTLRFQLLDSVGVGQGVGRLHMRDRPFSRGYLIFGMARRPAQGKLQGGTGSQNQVEKRLEKCVGASFVQWASILEAETSSEDSEGQLLESKNWP